MQELDIGYACLESPSPGARLSAGRQVLRGWLVPKPSFHFTDVRARVGGRVFRGIYGYPRADLAAFFKLGRPHALAEFTIEVDLSVGSTVVAFDARENDGRWQPFLTATLEAERATAAVAIPTPATPVLSHEFADNLRLLLRSPTDGSDDERATQLVSETPWPRMLRDAHTPFHGHLDQPASITSAPFGQIRVLGWCFHETQVLRRAWVTTDLIDLRALELGGDVDLGGRFAEFAHARDCRVFGVASVPAQLRAPLTLRLYAELADGSLHLVLALLTHPVSTEESKRHYPVYSAVRLAHAAFTLWRTYQQAGVPVARSAVLAAIGRVNRDYRTEAPPVRRTARALPPAASGPLRRLVLITHNLNYEGAPLWLLEFARHLTRAHGVRLTLLTPADGRLRAPFESLGAEIRIVDPAGLLGDDATGAGAVARHAAALARTLDWSDVDAVVANTIVGFWGVPLARAARRPVLLHIHESTTPAVFFRQGYGAGVLPAATRALRDADVVNFIATPARAYYDCFSNGANYVSIPGWIDLPAVDAWRTQHPRDAMRTQLGYAPDELVVVNIGAVCDRKGQHVFLDSIELLWRRHPALARMCRFVLVGGRDDPYNESLRHLARDLARANISFVNETSTPLAYFLGADLFVCTSYEEAFPRVVLEAMAFSLPIVATAVHGIPAMIEAEKEGILVAPGDTEALMNALVRFLGAMPEARNWGERARRRVERDFRAETVLPRHAALVSGLAALRR